MPGGLVKPGTMHCLPGAQPRRPRPPPALCPSRGLPLSGSAPGLLTHPALRCLGFPALSAEQELRAAFTLTGF